MTASGPTGPASESRPAIVWRSGTGLEGGDHFIGRAAHGGAHTPASTRSSPHKVNRVEKDLACYARAHRFSAADVPIAAPSPAAISRRRWPPLAAFWIDRRSVPGESYDAMRGEIRQLLTAVESEMPGLATRSRACPAAWRFEHLSACSTRGSLALACRRLPRGAGHPSPARLPTWTDAALLSNFAATRA